ncbi:MAG: DUF3854 domain-containing protein [Oscillatoriaceae bacterium SKW80]|nr:DUF3854 domain-containing protein [Oscillatoriaceae bacterium SKW80]HIK27973.1 DUF3854 domain-containing protein [Oscillatoriaceae cyanobacterium M7585_C2015_266]
MIITQRPDTDDIFCPDSISQHHWEEWLQSGVNPSIIKKNVRSIYDSWEIDKLLNLNSKKRYKHSEDLVPAWVVSGSNPSSWERSGEGIQVKPDNPRKINGRVQKYLGAYGYGAAPVFLETDEPDFWQKVTTDKSIPVIITEGAKKAGCLLSNGYAAISIPGVSTCRKDGRLHKLINLLCGFGRTFYLCFDSDIVVKKPVQYALLNLSRDLAATGSKVMVIDLPEEYKGVDDFIVGKGIDHFRYKFDSAHTIEEWKKLLQERWVAQQDEYKELFRSKLSRGMYFVDKAWGNFLKWNELKQCIELNGAELDPDTIRLKIATELDMDMGREDAIAVVKALAKGNTYHPVRNYLLGLEQENPKPDLDVIENISSRYFGTKDPIYDIYMKRCLVGAVMRALKPGEKFDTAVILHGGQGAGKSTFWKYLFGRDWFSDSLGDANEKDELMKLHSFWCMEWSEFETVYRKKDVASLKKFMAAEYDAYRMPYERTITNHRRPSILVGTTNNRDILQDPTGDRRFWVVPVEANKIPVDQVRQERDDIWAAALYLYRQGYKPYLSPEEEHLHDQANEPFRAIDPWEPVIIEFLRPYQEVTTGQVADHLGLETSRQDPRSSSRIAAILRKIGWEEFRGGHGKNRPRAWRKISVLSGSSGSSGSHNSEPLIDKVFNPYTDDPLKNCPNGSVVDHSNSTYQLDVFEGTETEHDPLNLIQSPPGDPEGSGTQLAQSQSGFQAGDPLDPLENENFQKKNFLEEQDPQPHPSFSENKTKKLKVKGITGTWICKFDFGDKHININLTTPDGRGISVPEFCEWDWRMTFDKFKAIVRAEILHLECREILKDQTFDVNRRAYDEKEGIKNVVVKGCKLVGTPPACGGNFVFETPEGNRFPVVDMEDFEIGSAIA